MTSDLRELPRQFNDIQKRPQIVPVVVKVLGERCIEDVRRMALYLFPYRNSESVEYVDLVHDFLGTISRSALQLPRSRS